MKFLQTAVLAVAALASTTVAAQRPTEDYFAFDPQPGTIEAFPSYITLRGEDGAVIANGEKPTAVITLSCPDTEVIQMQTARLGSVYRISFPASVDIPTTPGDYTLYIPADRFAVDGAGNAECAFVYTIEAPELPDVPDTPGAVVPERDIHVTPAQGTVASLSEWSITFDCEWGLGDRSAKFRLTGPEGVDIPALRSYSTGSSYAVYLDDDAVLTAPGTYVFTIPAGKFVLGDHGQVSNPELNYTYTIPGDSHGLPEYSVSPSPGTYHSLDGTFTLTFAEGTVAVASESGVALQGPESMLDVTVSAEGSTLTVAAAKALTQEGAYVLTVGAGAITVDGVSGGSMRFIYHVSSATGEVWNGTYTATPADGSELESLKEVVLTFQGARKVKVSDTAGPRDFPTLYNASLEAVTVAIAFADDNVLMISLPAEVKVPGEYTLLIPASFVFIDGATPASNIALHYTIADNGSASGCTVTLSPAPGQQLNLAQAITVEFAGEGLASVQNDPFAWGTSAPRFTSADGFFCPSIQIACEGDLTYVLSHMYAFEDEGLYTLVIPDGYFTYVFTDGSTAPVPAVTAQYQVQNGSTAISSVGAECPDAEVYTLGGVPTGVKASQIHSLPAGIYIVKDRKVIK